MRLALRALLLLCALLAVIGLAVAGWRAVANRTTTLRIAVTGLDSDEARLAGALNRWMAGKSSRYRLRPVVFPGVQAGLDAVVRREADLVIARADQSWPAEVASGLVMFRQKLVMLATPRGGVTSLAQLQGKSIGLLGNLAPDDPLLAAMMRLHRVTQPCLTSLAEAEVETAIARNTVQVLAFASPLSGAGATHDRVDRLLRSAPARGMTLLGLADGEATSALDRRYDSHDIAPGALRAQPPLPPETESVLSVAHHLVLRRSSPGIFVSRFIGELMDARRGVLATTPLAGQMDAPDEEARAAAPVHPGASAYFNDEDLTLSDLVSEWGYLVLLVIGGVGSGLIGLLHWLWPKTAESTAAQLLAAFLALRREADRSSTGPELRVRFEDLMQQMETALAEGRIDANDVAALVTTAAMAERRVNRAVG